MMTYDDVQATVVIDGACTDDVRLGSLVRHFEELLGHVRDVLFHVGVVQQHNLHVWVVFCPRLDVQRHLHDQCRNAPARVCVCACVMCVRMTNQCNNGMYQRQNIQTNSDVVASPHVGRIGLLRA